MVKSIGLLNPWTAVMEIEYEIVSPGFPSAATGETLNLNGASCPATGTMHTKRKDRIITAFIYGTLCSIKNDSGFGLITISFREGSIQNRLVLSLLRAGRDILPIIGMRWRKLKKNPGKQSDAPLLLHNPE
jgi:hypothetical protein